MFVVLTYQKQKLEYEYNDALISLCNVLLQKDNNIKYLD